MDRQFVEVAHGSCTSGRSIGTMRDACRSYFMSKPLRERGGNPDAQDWSCIRRAMRRVAECLGALMPWEDIAVESLSMQACDAAYGKLLSEKRCSEASARRAADEDFRVCARMLSKLGVGDSDNPFLAVRMARNPKAKPPKEKVTYPSRPGGKVCSKKVVRTRREPPGSDGLGLVGMPDPVEFAREQREVVVERAKDMVRTRYIYGS